MNVDQTTQSEKEFYKDSRVSVTQVRLTMDDKTFAMRNISSAESYRIKRDKTRVILVIILGILILFFGDRLPLAGKETIIGIFIIAIGILIMVLMKDKFVVKITSNSGETAEIISKNESYTSAIVYAVNEAIACGV